MQENELREFLRNSEETTEGLTTEEVDRRLEQFGYNEMIQKAGKSAFSLFIDQFKDFIMLILLAATLASFLMGETIDAIAIIIIVVMNAILGFIQEYRTEKSLEALNKLSAPQTVVLRDGEEQTIPARQLVPGDVLILESGSIVPADCILLEGETVQVNESILTGESVPVDKNPLRKFSIDVREKLEKQCLLFMGTTLTIGRGKAITIHTGMQTEMGNIAHMLESVKDESTPLQKRLDTIGKQLVLISLAACILIMLVGIYHGETIFKMLLSAISLAVAAIPEGLPAIVTVSLAIGVQRMLKRNALVRKLPAVETLGCTDVICSDKTGTLTENRMTVIKVYTAQQLMDVTTTRDDSSGEFMYEKQRIHPNRNTALMMLLKIGALCNNAGYHHDRIMGDPTEVAIFVASQKGGIADTIQYEYTRFREIPFDSNRKLMSVVCRDSQGNYYLFVKGASDRVLKRCTQVLDSTGSIILSLTNRSRIVEINEKMAEQALRVLGFAYKKIEAFSIHQISEELEKNLVFVGLEGMMDPPRKEAVEAIRSCYMAGIRPVMITGDHKTTAVAVAQELHMKMGEHAVLSGDDIENMEDRELEKKVQVVTVFARVTPRHKLRIVQAFKKHNNIVAMTGDGVNDAPALKEAHIGIAMGKTGTDVAKEASDMILLDDNFATIVAAIKEGRMIYDNIRKFIRYLLACNFSEILVMAIAAIFAMPVPLIPIQILWVNLVTDGLPALALGVDPPDDDIMQRPPRKSNESIFSRGLGGHILLSGLLISMGTLAAFILTLATSHGDLAKARTVAFATIILAELLYSFESRSEYKSIFSIGFFKNQYLVLANLSSFLLMLMVLYTPFLSAIFETTRLSIKDWMSVVSFAVIEFIISNINMLWNEGQG